MKFHGKPRSVRWCFCMLALVLGWASLSAQDNLSAKTSPAVSPRLSGGKPVPVTAPMDLFNGKNLAGWIYLAAGRLADIAQVCSVKDGVIAVTGVPGKATGYLALPEVRENYQLHVEWRWSGKVTSSTNSGVLLHISPGALLEGIWPVCFQIQTKFSRAGDVISMSTAACAEAAAGQTVNRQKDASEKPAGEWNSADITVRGNTIECVINGVVQNKVTKCVPSSGQIGFQLEGYPFEMRNIKLSPLEPAQPASTKTN